MLSLNQTLPHRCQLFRDLSFPFPLCVLTPHPPPPPIRHLWTELHQYFAPYSPPSVPVLDCMSTWKNFYCLWTPMMSLRLAELPPLTLPPSSLLAPEAPRRVPVSATYPLSVCLPFAVLNVVSAPVDPCGLSLLGSVLPPPFNQITPLPCRSLISAQKDSNNKYKPPDPFPPHPLLFYPVS